MRYTIRFIYKIVDPKILHQAIFDNQLYKYAYLQSTKVYRATTKKQLRLIPVLRNTLTGYFAVRVLMVFLSENSARCFQKRNCNSLKQSSKATTKYNPF